jgi:pilus assembly protein CpaC
MVPTLLKGQVNGGLIEVASGNAAVVVYPGALARVLITDPAVADAIPVSSTEVVLSGHRAGTTSLLLWGRDGVRISYQVRVSPDVEDLQEELRRVFPRENLRVRGVGESIVLSGLVSDEDVAAQATVLAERMARGVPVVDHFARPVRPQVLLQVRFAEVNRNAVRNLGSNLIRVDPANLRGDDEGAISTGGLLGSFLGEGPDVSFSDQVNFYLFQRSSNVAALIQALQGEGLFRSLAEPNLLAIPGETATFLAGGEFPYPVVQGTTQTVTVQFREFGIRLAFTPTLLRGGGIRLAVAPEVSSLDFSSGIRQAGFTVPALLTRKAETVVELAEGQTFAIAGLMDNAMTSNVNRIPLLGDIPILGALFRSESIRQNRTELLVLVTPLLIFPSQEAPELPTGEVESWQWMRYMRPQLPRP